MQEEQNQTSCLKIAKDSIACINNHNYVIYFIRILEIRKYFGKRKPIKICIYENKWCFITTKISIKHLIINLKKLDFLRLILRVTDQCILKLSYMFLFK